MKNQNKIDAHQHIVPLSSQIPKSIKKAGYYDTEERDGKQFMTQNFIKWQRPVSDKIFFLEPRLEFMAKHNIVHAGILTLSQFYCNLINKSATLDIIKFQNDFHLEIQEQHPTKFSCGFVVQPRYINEALDEIMTRVDQGLKFLCLPTHYKTSKREGSKWVSCTDKNCERIFELANHLYLPVQFHPYDYEEFIRLDDLNSFWSGHTKAMGFLTGHLFDQFTLKNFHLKYPKMRTYFSHANLTAITTMGRTVQAWSGRPDLFPNVEESPSTSLKSKNIFYDTITHDPDVLNLLLKKISQEQLMFGTDIPYPLGEGIPYVNKNEYPGCVLDKLLSLDSIGFRRNGSEKENIGYKNFANWLYGENFIEKEKFFDSLIYQI